MPHQSWIFRSWLARGLLAFSALLFITAALLPAMQSRASVAMPEPVETIVALPLPAWVDSTQAADLADSTGLANGVDEADAGLAPPTVVPTNPALYVEETRVRAGDTLAAILQRLHVNQPGLQAFLTVDRAARSIYKLYPGRIVQAAIDANGNFAWLRYYHTPTQRQGNQVVSRWLDVVAKDAAMNATTSAPPHATEPTAFQASEQSQPVSVHTRLAQGVIQSSLFGATDAAGVPDTITLQMADILNSRVDFARDLRKGDRFRVVYETYTHQGRPVGAGRVLALEFENANTLHTAMWFHLPADKTTDKNAVGLSGYFDVDGRSLRGMFLRSALKFSRISSTFGMRRHPIHGKWAGHRGVDYAAPSGTPIHATAAGVITFIGTQRGYGNVIHVKHNNRYATVYAHQRGFAKGLKKGSRVEQGQLLGYVGMTGWATGPHLHYELRVNNTPVNPLSVSVPVAHTLTPKQRKAFESVQAGFAQQMQMLATLQDVRDDHDENNQTDAAQLAQR